VSELDPRHRRNRLLSALTPTDVERIAGRLEVVDLPTGVLLSEPGRPLDHVYFPTTAVVSVVNRMSTGDTVEVGTIGNEGLVGLAVFLDADVDSSHALVQVAGEGARLPVETFKEIAHGSSPFERGVLRYTQAFLTQVSQTASCNRVHSLEQRCARWLLTTHDRVGRDTFALTHEFLSQMLGVRRAGVSVAAGHLQRAGAIKYLRGRVTVVDRTLLERASCECYAVVRAVFDRLVAPLPQAPAER